MIKNRAGLLAIVVLAVATILMVFFVLPRIGDSTKSVGDAINEAGTELKNTVTEGTKTTRNAASIARETAEKLGSLSTDAGKALSELKALLTDGKGPPADAFAAAKTKAVTALKALADFAAPEDVDAATAALVAKARDGASKALTIIQSMPENIVDALAAIARAEAALTGAPEPQKQTSAQTDNGKVVPRFDVLRVEPDGSTVIAGSAEAGSKLEILDGHRVVTTTDVGESGDFAAVLDKPLPAGDHQLVLKATGKDGKSIISDEVATISVPQAGGSGLLAMVTKPGEASRIITAPTAAPATGMAAALPAPAGSDVNAAAGTSAPSNEVAAVPNSSSDISPAPTAGAGQPNAAAPTETPDVRVNAVEIEGSKIFVAGSTRPNARIRAYADDQFIGETLAGRDGHFVIDGVMALSVGDHRIRVDVVDAGGNVLVRASVNFNRPAGDQVTVAAQPADNSNGASTAMVPLDEGQIGKLKEDAVKAFGLLKGLFVDGKLPGDEQLAAARSGTEIALRSLAEFRPAPDAKEAFKQAAASASQTAARALGILQALPKNAQAVGDALDRINTMIASLAPSSPAPEASVEMSGGDAEPKTIEQAPLEASNSAVIIRRGDTLWQISRRIYGLGVRYTTIYVANEDQILNPDRIRPGQVFGLPKEALPNAEELHRKRLSGEHL